MFYERFEKLLEERNVTVYHVGKATYIYTFIFID